MPNGHILSRRYARRLRKRLRQPLDRHQHADAPNGLLSFAIFFEMLVTRVGGPTAQGLSRWEMFRF